jgi:hypothetical protein
MPFPRSFGTAHSMKMSDRFSISNLDYSTWAAKMVAEGKLVEPTTNKTVIFCTAASSVSFDNVKCGVLASGTTGFQQSKEKACTFVRKAATGLTLVFQHFSNEEFCAGAQDDTCVTVIDAVFGAAGAYLDGGLADLCPQVFDEIFQLCPGGVGGTAEITLTRNDGQVFSGSVGAINFEDDTGTCPANPITDIAICQAVLAG